MKTYKAEIVINPHAKLGEGPIWDARTESLFWLDIMGKKLFHLSLKTRKFESFNLSGMPGCVVLTKAESRVLVALHDEGIGEFDLNAKKLRYVCDVPGRNGRLMRFNDGKADAAGRMWISTMSLKGIDGKKGALYCFDMHRKCFEVISDLSVSNGMAWSEDTGTFYHIDTPDRVVRAYVFDVETGRLGTGETVLDFTDYPSGIVPDGMTIDNKGNLWIAFWGGGCVQCFDPKAQKLLGEVKVPATYVTSCIFGGVDMKELFITTASGPLGVKEYKQEPNAGGLFSVVTDSIGLCEPCCRIGN